MVIVACPAPGCIYETEDLPAEIVVQLLSIHALEHSRAQIPASRGPKLTRPTIDMGVDEETWNAFLRRWETFKLGSGISEDAAPTQLFQCTSEALGDLLLKADPRLTTRTTAEVIKAIKQLAVIPVSRGVIRAELFQMKQSSDEPVRTFAARVRGKAETCGFTTVVACPCGETLNSDYTEEVIRDVLLAGLADLDIRREALSMTDIQDKHINDVVGIIESREMARNATPLSSVSAMSSYKQGKQSKPQAISSQKTVPCPECRKPFLRFRERPGGGLNKNPYKTCLECWKSSKKRSKEPESSDIRAMALDNDEQVLQISALGSNDRHPKVIINVGFAGADRPSPVQVEAIADTGAMSNVWGLQDFQEAGLSSADLNPTSVTIRAANGQTLDVCGQFEGVVTGKSPDGEDIVTKDIVYVSSSLKGFFLSRATMIKLYIIDDEFPVIG